MAFVSNAPASASILNRVQHAWDDVKVRYAKWQLFRATRDELMSLSNRELNDLGIARANIHSIAYETAYK